MSSDSSDDENLALLKEATDFQFINDSMFNGDTESKPIKEKPEKIPSLRRNIVDEDEQFNLFRVTPEFRAHVAKHLSKSLEEFLSKNLVVPNADDVINKTKTKPRGVKLFRVSKHYIKVNRRPKNEDLLIVNACNKARVKSKQIAVSLDDLKAVSVSGEDILNKSETKSWSNRSKAQVFKYKKQNTGELVEIT